MYFKTSDGNEDVIPLLLEATVEIVNNSKHANHPRIPNRNRSEQKLFWSQGYSNWSEEEFKDRLRINRRDFEYILAAITPHIRKEPTVMIPEPIECHRQLALTLYRLAHGCSFKVLKDVFGVSQSVATETGD